MPTQSSKGALTKAQANHTGSQIALDGIPKTISKGCVWNQLCQEAQPSSRILMLIFKLKTQQQRIDARIKKATKLSEKQVPIRWVKLTKWIKSSRPISPIWRRRSRGKPDHLKHNRYYSCTHEKANYFAYFRRSQNPKKKDSKMVNEDNAAQFELNVRH